MATDKIYTVRELWDAAEQFEKPLVLAVGEYIRLEQTRCKVCMVGRLMVGANMILNTRIGGFDFNKIALLLGLQETVAFSMGNYFGYDQIENAFDDGVMLKGEITIDQLLTRIQERVDEERVKEAKQ